MQLIVSWFVLLLGNLPIDVSEEKPKHDDPWLPISVTFTSGVGQDYLDFLPVSFVNSPKKSES